MEFEGLFDLYLSILHLTPFVYYLSICLAVFGDTTFVALCYHGESARHGKAPGVQWLVAQRLVAQRP